MEKISGLERFIRSRVAIAIVFILYLTGSVLYAYHYLPNVRTQHFERQTPLPTHYTVVDLKSDEKVFDSVGAYIKKRFGKDALVQDVSSPEIYNKLFHEEQEHVVFMSDEQAGFMTVDRSIVWVYKVHGFGTTTFSIADNALVGHMVIGSNWVLLIFFNIILSMCVCALYTQLIDLGSQAWSKLRRRSTHTTNLMI